MKLKLKETELPPVQLRLALPGQADARSIRALRSYYRKLWIGDGMKKAAYPSA